MAFEIKRVDLRNGSHEVHVAVSVEAIVPIVVRNDHLDTDALQSMMDLAQQRHEGHLRVREGLPR